VFLKVVLPKLRSSIKRCFLVQKVIVFWIIVAVPDASFMSKLAVFMLVVLIIQTFFYGCFVSLLSFVLDIFKSEMARLLI